MRSSRCTSGALILIRVSVWPELLFRIVRIPAEPLHETTACDDGIHEAIRQAKMELWAGVWRRSLGRGPESRLELIIETIT